MLLRDVRREADPNARQLCALSDLQSFLRLLLIGNGQELPPFLQNLFRPPDDAFHKEIQRMAQIERFQHEQIEIYVRNAKRLEAERFVAERARHNVDMATAESTRVEQEQRAEKAESENRRLQAEMSALSQRLQMPSGSLDFPNITATGVFESSSPASFASLMGNCFESCVPETTTNAPVAADEFQLEDIFGVDSEIVTATTAVESDPTRNAGRSDSLFVGSSDITSPNPYVAFWARSQRSGGAQGERALGLMHSESMMPATNQIQRSGGTARSESKERTVAMGVANNNNKTPCKSTGFGGVNGNRPPTPGFFRLPAGPGITQGNILMASPLRTCALASKSVAAMKPKTPATTTMRQQQQNDQRSGGRPK